MKENSTNNTITFLGTGGGRGMITSQTLATGGLWLNLDGTQILVDPGPGCIVRATEKNLNPQDLSAIILTHRHLDHSADLNIMVEAMTRSGHNQHGLLFVPAAALDHDPVIFTYLRNFLDGVELLEEGGEYSVNGITFSTPVRHIHKTETYGILFKNSRYTFSYIADTRYFDEIGSHYKGDLLIINTLFLEPRPESTDPLLPTDHLGIPDADIIIRELKPKTAIITHFGMRIWEADPEKVAQELSAKTGIRIIAAKDGMVFNLSELD